MGLPRGRPPKPLHPDTARLAPGDSLGSIPLAVSPTYATLASGTVSTVTLVGEYNYVRVIPLTITDHVYISPDGVTAPTVGGDTFFVAPLGATTSVKVPYVAGSTVVKLISNGAGIVGVEGLRDPDDDCGDIRREGVSNNVPPPMRQGIPLDVPTQGTVGSAASASLAAAAGKFTWITGFQVTWAGDGTGAVNDTVFVTAGTLSLQYRITTVAGVGGQLVVAYPTPIPCSTVNTAITVGVSGVANRAALFINAHGFQL